MSDPRNARAAPAALPESQTSTSASNVVALPAKFDPTKVKVLKQVSTNLLKLRPGAVVFMTITGPSVKSKPLKNASEEDKKKEPPTLLPIVNLETGEVQSIIVGAVLIDLLNDEYAGNKYVGKSFRLTVKEQKDARAGGGRRYNNYDLVEIQV